MTELDAGTGTSLRALPLPGGNKDQPESIAMDGFRTRWATHNVLQHRTGVKTLRHPVVGELTLGYEALELPADTGLTIMAYSAEPATPARDALNLLASWAATTGQNNLPDSENRPSSAS